jgi:hypothetical protein
MSDPMDMRRLQLDALVLGRFLETYQFPKNPKSVLKCVHDFPKDPVISRTTIDPQGNFPALNALGSHKNRVPHRCNHGSVVPED